MNAVITGASRGIGKALAEIFALNGYNIFLCSRSEEKLWPAIEELKTKFPAVRIDGQALDLSDAVQCRLFGEWVLGQATTVDVLINNAGTFVQGEVSNEPEGSLSLMLNTNLNSAYNLTRSLLPRMENQGSGHIFNICSIAALAAYPGGGAYSISKSALLSFSRNLRFELRAKGVKVTAVIPGAVYTDSWKSTDVAEDRLMDATDVARMIFCCTQLSAKAVVEELVMRPQLGDL